jgi:hypothetical protein
MIEQTDLHGQLDWLVEASGRESLPADEIRAHFAPVAIEASGGPAALGAGLTSLGAVTLAAVVAAEPEHVQARVRAGGRDYLLTVHTDAAGLIDGIGITGDEPLPTSWAELDERLVALAPRASLAAAEIDPDGAPRIRHGVDADVQRPIGSAFKLYVLGALGRAVAEGRAAWDEQLTIRDELKSLPSGVLQNRPAGTELALAAVADHMIALSDNTATDHLIHRLGRAAVAEQLALFGNRCPQASAPFLSTRAFFQLKCGDPARTEAYLAMSAAQRAAEVAELERLALPEVREAWPEPRWIDRIEWFAAPADICRAYAGLLRLDQPEIDHALSLDRGLGLDRTRFPTVWSKAGSEPGVLTLNHLARTADGRTQVVSLMVSDPDEAAQPIALAAPAQALIRGAFDLLQSESRP